MSKNRTCVLLLVGEPQYFAPESEISQQWLEFKDILLKYQIFNCDFFITCYFSDCSHDAGIKYLNTNFYDWVFHKFSIDMIPVVKIPEIKELENNITELHLDESRYKFSHLSFTHRMHRQLFSKFIIKENLFQNNLIAINKLKKKVNFLEKIVQKDKVDSFNTEDVLIKTNQKDDWFYNKHLLDLWRDVPLKYYRHPDINDEFDAPYLNFLHKASFNIVSESVFNFPFPYFSEKTLQSLLTKRPFIILGPCGNLQHLRDRGFKTFHSIIDESYDNISDPNKRLEAIMRLVLELNKKSQQELNDMVYAVKDIMIHNYSLILEKIRNFTNITE